MAPARADAIVIGRVQGAFGVHGWLRILSYARPRAGIFDYSSWQLRRASGVLGCEVLESRVEARGLLARISGIADRDSAAALTGAVIEITRAQLPPAEQGEYYWADLIGLTVRHVDGRVLGKVVSLIETGANDVLVVRDASGSEVLVPYVYGHWVEAVSLEDGTITVSWEAP